MGRLLSLIAALYLLACGALAQTQPATEGAEKPMLYVRVGVVKNSPYAESLEEGLAVDLWEEMGRRADLDSEMVWMDSLDQAMEELKAGRIQAVVGALPAEPDLARDGYLSLPYTQQTLGLLSVTSAPSPLGLLKPLYDIRILALFGLLLGVAFVFGLLFWIFERNHEKSHFPGTPGRGVLQGMWLSLITVTTVGYGDVAIRTTWGRFIASILLILTIIVQAAFTAALASVLTVASLGMGPASSVSGLDGQKVAVIGGGSAEEQLRVNGAEVKHFPNFETALEAVEAGKVSGIAGPTFELQMLALSHPEDHIEVADLQASIGDLHFALSPELQRELNSVIISTRKEGLVKRLEGQMLARGGRKKAAG
jgi:polar amino acid transport system substrate-binding protein